jgi:hypothetical protein
MLYRYFEDKSNDGSSDEDSGDDDPYAFTVNEEFCCLFAF